MKADAHIHLFSGGFLGPPSVAGGIVEYEQMRQLGGIDEALVVGYEGEAGYFGNNDYILDLSRRIRWIKPLYFVDSTKPPPNNEMITFALTAGFRGIALYLNQSSRNLPDWPLPFLRDFGRPGIIVNINAPMRSINSHALPIRSMESSSVLISHLGLPGQGAPPTVSAAREALAPLLGLARCKHVSVKLSGLYVVDPHHPYVGAKAYVSELLEAFGPERILWGSDFSPALAHGTMRELADLPAWVADMLTIEEIERVTGNNLRQLLHAAERT